jgi:exopolysaccharide production protein ExoZ
MTLLVPATFRNDATIHASFLFKSLFFISFTGNLPPALYVGWSLEFEMFFYLLVALMMVRTRRATAWHDVIPVLFSLLVALGLSVAIQRALGPFRFFTSPYLIEFVLGIVAARLFIGDTIPRPVLVIVAASLAAMLIVPHTRPGAVVALVFAVLVFAAAKLSARRKSVSALERGLEKLGDASYSIYLVQVFTIPAVCKAAVRLAPAIPLDLLIAVAASITILAGYGLYRFFEMPVLTPCRRMRSAPAVPAPGRA